MGNNISFLITGKLAALLVSMGRNTISCDPQEECIGMIKKEIIEVKASSKEQE